MVKIIKKYIALPMNLLKTLLALSSYIKPYKKLRNNKANKHREAIKYLLNPSKVSTQIQ